MSLKSMQRLVLLLVLLVVIFGLLSFVGMNRLDNSIHLLQDSSALKEAVADLQILFGEVVMPANDYLITGNSQEKENFAASDREVRAQMEKIRQLLTAAGEDTAVLDRAAGKYQQVVQQAQEIFSLSDPRHDPRGGELMEAMDAKADKLAHSLEELHTDAVQHEQAAAAAADRVKTIVYAITVIFYLLAVITGVIIFLLIKNQVISPLLVLSQAAGKVAAGDLRLEEIKVKGKGEVATLSSAFHNMVRSLRSLLQKIASSSQTVAATSNSISLSIAETSKGVEQIANGITALAKANTEEAGDLAHANELVAQLKEALSEIAASTNEQAVNVASARNALQEVREAVEQMTWNISSIESAAKDASEKANKGKETVDRTVAGMEKIKEKVYWSADQVRALHQHSEQIGQILQVIDDIAEQTNMLALNAAIEAARAGEHGKGFAVVAEEVRKLAERSAKATREIAALISTIQDNIDRAVTAMEVGTSEVDRGVELASEAGTALNVILEKIQQVYAETEAAASHARSVAEKARELDGAVNQIARAAETNSAATEEIAASSEQVANFITNVAAISQENAASTEEISASAQEINAAVQEISASIQTLSHLARELKEEVEKFRV